jgi:hypothetical protein
VEPIRIPLKARRDTLHQTCLFASDGICGSCSAFMCVWGVMQRRTILHAHVGLVRIPKKRDRRRYVKLAFLHPVGSTGHIVHCSASRAQNLNALFFLLGWHRYGFHKKRTGTRSASGGIYRSRSAFWCIRGVKRRYTILHTRVGLVQILEKAQWVMLCRTCVFVSSGIYGSRCALRCVRGAKC